MNLLMISIMRDFRYSNIGIDQLTAYLRLHHIDVDVVYFHNGEPLEKISSYLEVADYDLYCFSIYSTNLTQAEALATIIKQKHPSACVMWGGSFVTQYYSFFDKRCAAVDYFVLGDGEYPTLLLVECLAEGRTPRNPAIVRNGEDSQGHSGAVNDSFVSMPIFDYYENDTLERNRLKTHCVQTKNNICTGNCSFCFERKGKIKYKSVEAISNEIATICGRFGLRKIFISDDNIFDPDTDVVRDRIKQLCQAIIKLPYRINLTCYATACSLYCTEKDECLLDLMNQAGFTSMFIGIESGNVKDLELYRKKANLRDNERVVSLLRRHNINPIVGFINFNPYSTLNTLIENLNYLDRIGSANLNNYVNSFLEIYPGTAIWKKARADGLLMSDHDYRHTLRYHFKNECAGRIANYIHSHLTFRNNDFEITASQLLLLYYDMLHISPKVLQFEQEVFQLVAEHHAMFDLFFRNLYTTSDIENFPADNLINFLIQSQPKLHSLKVRLLQSLSQGMDNPSQIKLIKGMYN